MHSIKKILIPIDFSETAKNAFNFSLQFARNIGADIELLHCVYPGMAVTDVPTYASDITGKLLENGQNNMAEFIDQNLAAVREQMEHLPNVSKRVEIGEMTSTTKMIAEAEVIDLIIMGTKGAFGTWNELWGSNASGTLANAPCPVLILPNGATFSDFKKICFATDLESASALSGPSMIESFNFNCNELHFVHVNKVEQEAHTLDASTIHQFYQSREVPFKVSIAEIVATDVANTILEEAAATNCDLIVMSRPNHSLFDQFFHKSQTREVALHTPLPLLVLNEESA